MSAPIRPEHREAARALVRDVASERLNSIGGVVGYFIELSEEIGERNEERIAQALADVDAAATERSAERIAMLERERDEARLEAIFGTPPSDDGDLSEHDIKTYNGILRLLDIAKRDLSALRVEYRDAVRALRGVRPKYGHFCPALWDERRFGHIESCVEAERVLSTESARGIE